MSDVTYLTAYTRLFATPDEPVPVNPLAATSRLVLQENNPGTPTGLTSHAGLNAKATLVLPARVTLDAHDSLNPVGGYDQPASAILDAGATLATDAVAEAFVATGSDLAVVSELTAQADGPDAAALLTSQAVLTVGTPILEVPAQVLMAARTFESGVADRQVTAQLVHGTRLTASAVVRIRQKATLRSASRLLASPDGVLGAMPAQDEVVVMPSRAELIAKADAAFTEVGTFFKPVQIKDCPGGRWDVPTTLDPYACNYGIWFAFQAQRDETINFAWGGPEPVFMQAYQSPGLYGAYEQNVTLMTSGTDTLQVHCAAGNFYYLAVIPQRVLPDDGKFWIPSLAEWLGGLGIGGRPGDWFKDGSLEWWCEASRIEYCNLIVTAPVVYGPMPGAVLTSVHNATPHGRCSFIIDGDAVAYLTADDSGQVLQAMIPLPVMLPGTHELRVVDQVTGCLRDVQFEVTGHEPPVDGNPPFRRPEVPGAKEGTARWMFIDTLPIAEVYYFPTNPETMTSPHTARVYTAEHTTARVGQPIVFEGSPNASEWTFGGTVRTRDEQLGLERFQALQRRIWVIDHLRRAWLCTFETLDWTEVRQATPGEVRKYQAKMFIYEGPVWQP